MLVADFKRQKVFCSTYVPLKNYFYLEENDQVGLPFRLCRQALACGATSSS